MEEIILTSNEKDMADEIKEHINKKEFRKPLNFSKYPERVLASLSLFPSAFVNLYINDKSLEISKLNKFKKIVEAPESKERNILNFFKDKSNINMLRVIFRQFNTGHHGQYIFREFSLPNNNHIADFLLIGKDSDGYHEIFVEFEAINTNKNSKIFTKGGGEGSILRKGREQVQSWEDCITKQHQAHADNLRKQLNKSSLLPNELQINSPSRRHYVVVAGRRNDYKANYDLRLSIQDKNNIKILHYDRIIEDIQNELKGKKNLIL